MSDAPIGVFDSGVGGLSVLREIRGVLPREDLLYVADSGAAPYGERPKPFIRARAEAIARFFIGEGVKAIVVACNTATAVAVQALRERFTFPIIAIEPAVKPAAGVTRTGTVGVLATRQTLASESFSRLMQRYGNGARLLLQPCPGFVELVEQGELSGPRAEALVRRFVTPLVEQGADTIVLGCTHYPFLSPVIRYVAGPDVVVIDPAAAVARHLHHQLESVGLLSAAAGPGIERFWTSGSPEQAETVVSQLWGRPVRVDALPGAYCMQPEWADG